MKSIKNELVAWIKEWFQYNGRDCRAVIGISGGKDSSVAAALCVEALGRDRVIGVMMPNVCQPDIDYSYKLIEHLNIESYEIPITLPVSSIVHEIESEQLVMSTQAIVNLPARIRMATLYAVSQSVGGRVVNTCNLSEEWIGYGTRYGDSGTGDLCPLAKLTMHEVKALGYELGLPEELIEKAPSDGLCGLTDEDNFGFTYEVLDRYIRTGACNDPAVKQRIDDLHEKNKFKQRMPEAFFPDRLMIKGASL